MTCVDIGANRGYFTLLFARLAGGEGRVIAFEPDSRSAKALGRSIALNGYTNVTLVEAAVADISGAAAFHLGKEPGYSTLTPQSDVVYIKGPARCVTTTTLARSLRELRVTRVDVLKIDVEGADVKVLVGAREILGGSYPMRIMMDIDVRDPGDVATVHEMLCDFGFSIFTKGSRIAPQLRRVTGWHEMGREIFCVRY
jgi:FkbM family methyltransferase